MSPSVSPCRRPNKSIDRRFYDSFFSAKLFQETSICSRIYIVYFPLLVLKGIYHYWKQVYISRGLNHVEGDQHRADEPRALGDLLPRGHHARAGNDGADHFEEQAMREMGAKPWHFGQTP